MVSKKDFLKKKSKVRAIQEKETRKMSSKLFLKESEGSWKKGKTWKLEK